MAVETCSSLRNALIEIAFILEPEAIEIEAREINEIKVSEAKYFK